MDTRCVNALLEALSRVPRRHREVLSIIVRRGEIENLVGRVEKVSIAVPDLEAILPSLEPRELHAVVLALRERRLLDPVDDDGLTKIVLSAPESDKLGADVFAEMAAHLEADEVRSAVEELDFSVFEQDPAAWEESMFHYRCRPLDQLPEATSRLSNGWRVSR
ncbi:hypothetical protein [Microbacterium excoecariae]|uniref:hypothetical protein n=1 Tax=Microbacterium excoecariae TaxID=2715210 RepID=UPI001408F798|nr:hypothetical protein [Microbacterium excoecariae]NHI16261.1 hypothetical protein [Microbacterium excoecariae]